MKSRFAWNGLLALAAVLSLDKAAVGGVFPSYYRPVFSGNSMLPGEQNETEISSTPASSDDVFGNLGIETAWAATVKIVAPRAQGTGVFVGEQGYILTALHVLQSDPVFSQAGRGAGSLGRLPTQLMGTDIPDLMIGHSIELVWASDAATDLALLRLVASPGFSQALHSREYYPCVPVAKYSPFVGADLQAFGFPVEWLDARMAVRPSGDRRWAVHGRVMIERDVLSSGSEFNLPELGFGRNTEGSELAMKQDFLIASAGTPGLSGGPVINKRGELQGIVVLRQAVASNEATAGWIGVKSPGHLPQSVQDKMHCPAGRARTGFGIAATPPAIEGSISGGASHLGRPNGTPYNRPRGLTLDLLKNWVRRLSDRAVNLRALRAAGLSPRDLLGAFDIADAAMGDWLADLPQDVRQSHLDLVLEDTLPGADTRGPALWVIARHWIGAVIRVAAQNELDPGQLQRVQQLLQELVRTELFLGTLPN